MHRELVNGGVLVAARPFLRWVGGKAWLVPQLVPRIRAALYQHDLHDGRYFEPFLGGGALALALGLPGMILGDLCGPLVNTYRAVATMPANVAFVLRSMERDLTSEGYYRVRDDYNRLHREDLRRRQRPSCASAAGFIYLNKTCFNGIYRENSRCEFNVPWGKLRSPKFPAAEELLSVSRAISLADLRIAPFQETIAAAQRGDVIYADPPYFGTFSDYTAKGFSAELQQELADALHGAVTRGATVFSTNSDCPEVREMYSWANLEQLVERRGVASKISARGTATTLLISTD